LLEMRRFKVWAQRFDVRWGGLVHGLIIVELHEFSYKLVIHACR
jgi:hypothetical protein